MAGAVVLVLAALLCRAAAEFEAQTCSVTTQATIQPGAEVMLGGIFNMGGGASGGYGCGGYRSSMQSYEALRYALELVNKKNEILHGEQLTDYYVPGVRIGMHVVDNCGNKDQGMRGVSVIFPSLNSDARSCSQVQSNYTLGIVESSGSGTAEVTTSFADRFGIPVVSFTSTAPRLTLSGKYPNFMRTIPHDRDLVKVMGQVLKRLNWDYVVVVYEDSVYGMEVYNAFRPVVADQGICLSAAIMVNGDDTSLGTMRSVLGQVVAADAVGVVFLGGSTMIRALLAQGPNVPGAKKLQWIVTDSIPLDTIFTDTYPRGLLAMVPASRDIVEFEDHWIRLDEENPSPENPWYQGWFMKTYQCDLGLSTKYGTRCSARYSGMTDTDIEREKRQNYVQDQFVESAVHAVFSYARALREAQQALCPLQTGLCPQLATLSHEEFFDKYLSKVDFTYTAQERVASLASDQYAPYKAAKRLRFDSRGDIMSPSFKLYNFNDLPVGESDSAAFKFREVGNYVNGRLTLTMDNIRMYAEDRVTPLVPLPASPCPASGCSPCVGVPEDMKYYFQDGDIVISGVFSLHKAGRAKFTCGELISRNPQYLEAMIYAVKKVNTDATLLRGVTLGGLGIDDCMDSDLSTNFMAQVMSNRYTVKDSSGMALDPYKVQAHSAAYNNRLTIPLAELLDVIMQPVVGYRATSAKLDRYKHYLKTVPSIEDEFRAIIMILKAKNWMYTQVLFSADAYDRDDVSLFRRVAASAGICVVADYAFNDDRRNPMDMLGIHSTVKPVVLLLSPYRHRDFLDVLNGTSNPNPNQFQFIATSTFSSDGYVTRGYETQASGFVSIDLAYSNLTQFYNTLAALRVDTYQDNPWFKEWFESVYDCQFGSFTETCNANAAITGASGFMKDLRTVHVINAVYAIARGLHSVLTNYCGVSYNGVCSQFMSANRANRGMDMVEEILKVSFPIEDSNPTQTFRFSNRGGAYSYQVYFFDRGLFIKVGTVTPSTYSISSLSGVPEAMSTCPKPCAECLYMFAYQPYWYLDGDLIIPAVFDVHYEGASMYSCGALRADNGFQYTEAFKFALDFVNSARSGVNLHNVSLGGLAFDGCSSSERTMAIINGVMGRSFPIMDNQGKQVYVSKLVSWLTYDSESTMAAGDLLKMMGVPLVSPGASAPQLLDKTRYSTFFRTIPSDTVVARAMATFIQARGWKYVITLNDPDAGSRKTRDLFKQYLKDMGICVMTTLEFKTDGSVSVILKSIQDSTTQIVAVFADPHWYVRDLLQLKKDSYLGNDVLFISSRYWELGHMDLDLNFDFGRQNIITNSLSFRLKDRTVSEFVTYLNGLTLAGSDNPWLLEYYQAVFRCDLDGNSMYGTACSSTAFRLGNSAHIYQHAFTLSTINAVHALADGLSKVLLEKCGAQYSGVCSRFLTDSDTMDRLMTAMDDQVFNDTTGIVFDFVQREANRGFEIMHHRGGNSVRAIADVSPDANLTFNAEWNSVQNGYTGWSSECSGECLMCDEAATNFRNFTYIEGDVYIVGLFDVHTEGSTPYTCGSLNDHQGLELLEAFHFAIEYINAKRGLFAERLRSVEIGAIGIDVCRNPSRAANLVANIHSGNFPLTLSDGFEISRRQILAYVGPFNTDTTIRVADILSAVGISQVTYGATGLALQDPAKYPYLLRSVPADDKQARAIISYLKNFNFTNVQVVTSRETIGLSMTQEFLRLATLNLVCIKRNYTLEEPVSDRSRDIVEEIVKEEQSRVVVLLVDDPLPILQAAGNQPEARDSILWIATDKWGYDTSFLEKLQPLLGDRRSKKNVIIFDVETADVPSFDMYLETKTPANYSRNPWFTDYYEWQFGCSVSGVGKNCDLMRGLPRREGYVQDPYVLYVINAVLSAGLGIDGALRTVCGQSYDGICPKFQVTGNRRDIVLSNMKRVNFTDSTFQPFYYEPTGESSRGYHIYNITSSVDGSYRFENVGSFNDSHFLKLDITYDLDYRAWCEPYESCVCVNPFPEIIPSRYMLQPSPLELNLVYIGDIHQGSPSDPFACGGISPGTDFYKMLSFFYAIERVNGNLDNRYPKSLQLGGIALDTCGTTLRLEQDIFNLLGGFPLCDTGESGQLVPPSSIVAFVPDGNANSIAVSGALASTGVTSVSPSATSPALRDYINSEHFLSIVPPDDALANAIVQVMGKMGWNYATVIYSYDPSMMTAQQQLLRRTAVDQTACIGQSVWLPMDADLDDANSALDRISRHVGARAVVLYTQPAHTRLLLQAAANRGRSSDRFVWLVARPSSRNPAQLFSGLEGQASGSLLFQPYSAAVDDFRRFVTSLTFTNRRGIPDDWFEEIYQTLHRCKIQDARRSLPFSTLCTGEERITEDTVPYEPSILHTVIAVYMVAQGLSQIPECRGSNYDLSACLTRLHNRDNSIYQSTLTAEWNVLPALLGNKSFTFAFTGDGYGNVGFDIVNYHSPTGSGQSYTSLGRYYTNSLMEFNTQAYQGLNMYEPGVLPVSKCLSTKCICQGPYDVYGVPRSWTYPPHQGSLEVVEEGKTYIDPATNEPFYVEKVPGVTSRFTDIWGVAVATLAAVGVFVSLCLFLYLLVVYPVRGGTSVLGYVLAFGIILLYGMVFAFVAHASQELCGLRRFGLGFCYAICYAALFVKLVDCWRSKEKQEEIDVKYSKLGRPLGLFMVVIMLVLVQVMISAEWLILEKPDVVRIFYNKQYWPRCTPDDFYDEGLVLSLCYIMAIILLTVLLGFCTFGSTKNHREARWILGMAVLAVPVWVVWCAWATMGVVKTRDAAVAVGLLINATVLLLLGPVRKLYLLNKYQAWIEEEDRQQKLQERERAVVSDYSNVYDNAPHFHDRASTVGSHHGSYRYPPSSVGNR